MNQLTVHYAAQLPLVARLTPTIIWDLDGVLADSRHRLPCISTPGEENWALFHAKTMSDKPILHNILIYNGLLTAGVQQVICTSRDDRGRYLTEAWLANNNVKGIAGLLMRQGANGCASLKLKAAMLDALRLRNYRPVCAFEDHPEIASMYRERGVPCWLDADPAAVHVDSRIVAALTQEPTYGTDANSARQAGSVAVEDVPTR